MDGLIKALREPSEDDSLMELKEAVPFKAETDSQQLALLGIAFTIAEELLPMVMSSIWSILNESKEVGTGVRVGRGGRGKRPREGNDERFDDLNGQGNEQGLRANGGIEGVNRNVEGVNGGENIGNVIVNGNRVGCSYKEFLACNPKEYDDKGGVEVLPLWIEKMEYVQDMSGCSIDQKVKYTVGLFVGKALTWWNSQIRTLSREVAVKSRLVRAGHATYTDRFHELARLVPHLVTPKSKMIKRYVYGLALQICGMVAATEPKTIQKAVQIYEPRKDKNDRDDNKRTRTGNAFAATANPIRRENTGIEPSELGFKYEIEIASGKLVEIDKVINGMDWLSNYKAEIICHEKVVRIPPLDGKVLRVLGERPEEKERFFMGAKAGDKKQEDIVVAIDFPE
ncbi:reverse transcriptase domain-containing protein, partial [Tanacetum coccineum]